ncbi:uncharacterized protein HMPREF1541_05738 [Cyphellophora europaea CBS 101466]|uniref:Uncharacterized protein n=1 Tax=Cyphellophora europaea (strain CBS 101466) TaxID=1220924 RepID=W2RST8_CYPE1|nr:uncharacterized protein HMPREF1541_05738 [Cyphellophora europaea CBS 101466]ETN39512.1 hypothetical protein HMPREF1541_05738 [Cyphellophora europaea CBS 101466]
MSDRAVVGWIKEYGSFGTFFSYGLDLFEKIPIVCSLAKECLNHWRAVRNGQRQPSSSRVDQVEPDSHAPSPPNAPPAPPASISRRVTHLISWLEAWESPEPSAEAAQSKQGHRAAGEFYRQALLIYLKACCVEHAPDAFMGPSTVPNEGSEFWPLPSAKMLADIAGHTEIVMGLAPILGMSRYGATSLWPLIIASSCFTDEDKRALLIESMDNTASYFYGAAQLERVVNVAQILWRDEGRKAFGPYGLEMIMKEHAYNLSMS